MVWRCMCINGLDLICNVDRHINQNCYLDILQENIPKIISKFNLDSFFIIFQQDNAPIHRAKLLQKWFSKQPFSLLPWPAQSLDLNSIDHLWAILKRRLNRYDRPSIGLIELWNRRMEIFYSITLADCKRLVESMSHRIQIVIVAKREMDKVLINFFHECPILIKCIGKV